MDIYAVKKLGRWKSLSMMMRYAHHHMGSLRVAVKILYRVLAGVSTIDPLAGGRNREGVSCRLVKGKRIGWLRGPDFSGIFEPCTYPPAVTSPLFISDDSCSCIIEEEISFVLLCLHVGAFQFSRSHS